MEGSNLALASVPFASGLAVGLKGPTLARQDDHQCQLCWNISAPAYCPLPRQTWLASQPTTSPSSSEYQKVQSRGEQKLWQQFPNTN